MADLQLLDCSQPALVKLERVHYFPRQLLTADDLTADSEYFQRKMRQHNRLLHGWGAVCGLAVSPAPTPELPWRVSIGDGYALGPYGDEIYVAEPVFLDLARCGPGTVTDPCAPSQLSTPGSATGGTIFVAIKYAECLARPVRAMPAGCACDEEACEYSRIRDSFQIECLIDLPPSHQPPVGPSLCDLIAGKQLALCPPCPAEPWVVLAQVTLPASPNEMITENQIDNFTFRRQVFSTGVLQEQLIKCCCPRPATVTVDPPNDTEFTFPNVPTQIVITFDKDVQSPITAAVQVMVSIDDGVSFQVVLGNIMSEQEQGPGDVTLRQASFNPNDPFGGTGTEKKFIYEITISGDLILDVDDLALDGNGDGTPGGDFISRFTILPPIIF